MHKKTVCEMLISIGLVGIAGGLFMIYGPAIPLITTSAILLIIGSIGLSR